MTRVGGQNMVLDSGVMKAMNIRPISELKNRTKALVAEVVDGGEPIVITQNGRPCVVLMGAKEYDGLHQTIAMMQLLSQSVESARKGPMYTTAEVRKRLNLRPAKAREKK